MISNNQSTIAAHIYWILPGPRTFMDNLTFSIQKKQVIVVERIGRSIQGFDYAFERALVHAHIESEVVVRLNVEDGTHIASDIGHHLGLNIADAQLLASMHHIRPISIVLKPMTRLGDQKCKEYLSQFSNSLIPENSNVRLLCFRDIQEELWPSIDGVLACVFNAALTPDEMNAYVSLRDIGGNKTGTTDLNRRLIMQYAGFDPEFAEELMSMSSDDLLDLPYSLVNIAHKMKVNDSVWRIASEQNGSIAFIDGKKYIHTLHEHHLATTECTDKDSSRVNLKARYWRAALQALMPWIEERRHNILDLLRADLERHFHNQGGKHHKKIITPTRSWIEEIEINDLEFNDIVSLSRNNQSRFDPVDVKSKLVIDACWKIKVVRDELAHLRCPSPAQIKDMVTTLSNVLEE